MANAHSGRFAARMGGQRAVALPVMRRDLRFEEFCGRVDLGMVEAL